jgi:hypothetical protein
MTARLSPAQELALRFVAANGGRLVRLPGGFWTYPGCPVESRPYGDDVPTDYVRTNTVRALVVRGELVETEHRTSRTISGRPTQYAVAVSLPETGATS